MAVNPAKTQISLGICPVWSESFLSAWRNLGSLATHLAHSEDSDQTGRMPRLIGIFAGRTFTLLVLSCCGSSEFTGYNRDCSRQICFLLTRLPWNIKKYLVFVLKGVWFCGNLNSSIFFPKLSVWHCLLTLFVACWLCFVACWICLLPADFVYAVSQFIVHLYKTLATTVVKTGFCLKWDSIFVTDMLQCLRALLLTY